MKSLSRNELKQIMGGAAAGGCIASCSGGGSVICYGSECKAQDGSGCIGSGSGEKKCDLLPSKQ